MTINAAGVILNQQTFGENVAAGQAVYLKSDGKWWLAKADAEATSTGEIGIARDTVAANGTGRVVQQGYVADSTWTWTIGSPIYLSAATAGALTQTRPVGIANIAREVGSAASATSIYFAPTHATGASEAPRTATYVVAASDAPAHVKRQADYVCDGTDDQVEIQAAIDALPALGGEVRLSQGTFAISTTGAFYVGATKYALKIEADNIALTGTPGTTIVAASGTDVGGTDPSTDFFVMLWVSAGNHIEVSGIAFDANSSAVTAGHTIPIMYYGVSTDVQIRRNSFANHDYYALWGDGGASQWIVDSNVVYGPASGIAIHNAGSQITISNNFIGLGSTCLTGIFIDTVANTRVVGNYVYKPGEVGILAYDDVKNTQIVGNVIVGKSGTGTKSGIKLYTKGYLASSVDYTLIAGNHFVPAVDDASIVNIGVRLGDAYVRYVEIQGNLFAGVPSSVYNDGAVTGIIIRDNWGYTTKNKGAAASTADGGTITHGCAAAPTTATVSGSVAGEIVTVTSIDATNITVAIKAADGTTPGTSQTVYWRAEV